MDIRIAKHSDYKTLKEWWSFWRFPAPSQESLPSFGKDSFNGIIASKNNKDIASGFLYETNSNMCWIEFIVTNPKTTSEERNEAILKVLEELSLSAKELGFSIVFSSIKNQNLINKYIESGFIEGTKGTSELIKIL
jgi:hypothetical protein